MVAASVFQKGEILSLNFVLDCVSSVLLDPQRIPNGFPDFPVIQVGNDGLLVSRRQVFSKKRENLGSYAI